MAHVLFVWLHNAGRSQMSRALFSRVVDGAQEGRCAGTTPAERVHPEVIEVMDELGIDLRDRVPQKLTQEMAEWAEAVVTMGCDAACPFVPSVRYIDWQLEDPSGQDGSTDAGRTASSWNDSSARPTSPGWGDPGGELGRLRNPQLRVLRGSPRCRRTRRYPRPAHDLV